MAMVKCKQCLSEIPKGAMVCKVCRSYQGWIRANLQQWQIAATFVVALSSLAASVYGLKTSKTHTPISKISLTQPQLHDGTVTLTAINVGDAPGSLQAGTITSDLLGGILQLTSVSADDEFVPVGSKRVTFRFHELLTIDQQRKAHEQMALFSPSSAKGGTISMTVVESDGTRDVADFVIPMSAFVPQETERMEKPDRDNATAGNSS